MNNIKKLGIYFVFSYFVILPSIITNYTPSFFNENNMSLKMIGYSLNSNYANILICASIIYLGIKAGELKNLNNKYLSIYSLNFLIFVILFLLTGKFTVPDLYNNMLPITRNTYPLLVGSMLAIYLRKPIQKIVSIFDQKKILYSFIIVSVLPSIFNQDIFGFGNGKSLLSGFMLTVLGMILPKEIKFKKKYILLITISNLLLTLIMMYQKIKLSKDISSALRFNNLTAPLIILNALLVIYLGKKYIRIQLNSLDIIIINLLLFSNEYILKALSPLFGKASLITLMMWAGLVSIGAIISLFILKFLHKLLKKYDSKIEKITVNEVIEFIKQNKFQLMNMVVLYILSVISIVTTMDNLNYEDILNRFMDNFFNRQNIILWNTLLYYLVYRIIRNVINKFWLSIVIAYGIIVAWIVANILKIKYRLEPVLPSDMSMALQVNEFISKNILGVFIAILLVLVMSAIYLDSKYKVRKLKLRNRIVSSISIVIFFAMSLLINYDTPVVNLLEYLGMPTVYYNQLEGAQISGTFQQFLNNVNVKIMDEPKNYSKENISSIYKKYEKVANDINKNRKNKLANQTIIFNLSESLSNPNRVKGITLQNNPLERIDEIKKDNTSGLMISSGYGGGTANMEYMTLTGFPYSNFSSTLSVPYTQIVASSKNSYGFNQLFPRSSAIHPFKGTYYSRIEAYPKLGFNRFYYLGSKYKIKHKKMVGSNNNLSDETAYENTLDVINGSKKGQFINLVTMQNHMPYGDYYKNSDKYKVISKGIESQEKNDVQNYSTGIAYSDMAVKSFINKIDKINKPITVVLYGDHLPGLYSHKGPSQLNLHLTDYFIYSNKYAREHGASNIRDKKQNYVIPSDFQAMVAEQTNSKVTPYLALLTKVQKELPSAKVYAFKDKDTPKFVDKNGKSISYRKLTKKQKELFNDLKLVQYDNTAGKNYLLKYKFYK